MEWDLGENAKKSSSTVIKMLERLLTTGFDKDVSIGLINSAVRLNSNEETYATIDLSVFDTKTGEIEFVKNGDFNEISEEMRLNYILNFSLEFLKYRGERGIFELRKFIVWLVKGMKRAAEIRAKIFNIKSLDDLYKILEEHKNVIKIL